jgi:phenylacetate-CoA ligase
MFGAKETPGVLKFQAIQTGPSTLKIRLEPKQAEETHQVWERVSAKTRDYLIQQGLKNVEILRAAEPPMRDPQSGKFRNVWVEKDKS